MTRVLAFTILLSLSSALAGHAVAQPVLTVEQAVQDALAHNRPLSAARTSVGEASAQVQAARAALFPRVTVSEAWQRGNQPVFVFGSLLNARRFSAANFAIDALNYPDPTGFFRTSIGVDQLLFDGGRSRATVHLATLQRDLAATGVDVASAGTAVAVTQAYGRLLASVVARRAAESAVATALDDVERARQRRDAGLATDADVLSLQVHVSELQQRVIQAGGDIAVARAELNRLMGSPIDRDYVPTAPAEPVDRAPGPLAALLADAERSRPELKRAATVAEIGDALQRQARAAFIPQLAAQGAVDVAGTSFADRASSWVFGGELRWTLSAGGAEGARVRAASEAASRARIERDEVRASVQVEVVSALARLEAARARQAVGRATVDQARESQRIIRDRFGAGMATATDVLRASTALLDAEAQQTSALVDAMISRALLDQATGRLAPGAN